MTSLSKNVKFSIEKNNNIGSFVVRSVTESFNLEHIVDKDIISFYSEISKYGIVDTGILPLSGTGILAIRSAGNHTQVTFQHAPQINHINWGAHEGDKNAKTYFVAQPYRIWIGDMIDGNLYGARMFYSPYPITSANQILYHLNLPNTNCKGYRGNGVGWQCLYHNEDWTNLPFNEKVIRFAERCSGVETFNDANMSETDGPRFYAEHYGHDEDYSYLWNPTAWQEKTSTEGLDWVFNENIWIPVKVEGLDSQDRHRENGVNLTLGMAMVGNYSAYYTDVIIPKPINALTRADLYSKITPETIASWIIRSHNSSLTAYVPVDTLAQSSKHREDMSTKALKITPISDDSEDEEEQGMITIVCPITGDSCTASEEDVCVDSLDNAYCQSCYEENTVYCENTDSSLPSNSPYVYWHESHGEYYDVRGLDFAVCENCSELHAVKEGQDLSQFIYFIYNDNNEKVPSYCISCIKEWLNTYHPEYNSKCTQCGTAIPYNVESNQILSSFEDCVHDAKNVYLTSNPDGQSNIVTEDARYCHKCFASSEFCPTGHHTWQGVATLPIPITHNFDSEVVTIHGICAHCANPDIWQFGLSKDSISKLSTLFSVITRAEDRFVYAYTHNMLLNNKHITIQSKSENPESIIDHGF